MAPNLHEPQGMNVSLICNISDKLTLMRWKKDEILLFAYSPLIDKEVRNFTSSRMNVDPATPNVLHISHVKESDEGTYTCEAISLQQTITQIWNLTTYSGISIPAILVKGIRITTVTHGCNTQFVIQTSQKTASHHVNICA